MNRTTSPNTLARCLRQFLGDHMPLARGLSPHTVRSYRDGFALLLRFLATRRGRDVIELDIDDLDPEGVIAFLDHLETDRENCAATRNVRLAAIHAFARFVAAQHPEHMERCQQLLGVPFKRSATRVVDYLEATEIRAILDATDRRSVFGRRDHTILLVMFNTGARVQELLDLTPNDLQLIRPYHARLLGKGRKERICPLWSRTAEAVRALIQDTRMDRTSCEPIFRNRRGAPLTRYGVRYLVRKYAALAQAEAPSLGTKRVHPHIMRHTSAVHLLQSGVDLVTISQWLGHASVETTNRYATVDLETKRAALEKARPVIDGDPSLKAWRSDESILTWLSTL